MSHKIKKIIGREVLDSRGTPTLEVELTLSDGTMGRAIVPSGASCGEHEALELRDGDKSRYLGKGVLNAVRNVTTSLSGELARREISTLEQLDKALLEIDGSAQKVKLGGNTILGISMAYVHAIANSRKQHLYVVINELMGLSPDKMSLPVPLMNIINGGAHANNGLEVQEFMIVPHGFENFPTALRAGSEIFHHLKAQLKAKNFSVAVGDEGGFAPDLETNEDALGVICDAIESAGYQLGKQVSLALDVASSEFFNKKTKQYDIRLGSSESVSSQDLLDYYAGLVEKFPIVSIEDGLDENDWEGWKAMTEKLGNRIQLVGDDLFVTQPQFVRKGIENHIANAVLIKVNQVGSMTETFETMRLCREANYRTVVSHRSGESEDVTIAHLAVGAGAGQIKTGSLSRGERTAKYNELLRIGDYSAGEGKKLPLANLFN